MFGIHYRDGVEHSLKKDLRNELEQYLKENYNIHSHQIMECNLQDRNQVTELAMETVKGYNVIDFNQLLKSLIKKEKKKCYLM